MDANQRERKRVEGVNGNLERLRAILPSAAKQKKMSQLDTLKEAAYYIRYLINLKSQLNESKLNEIIQENSTTSNPDLMLQQPAHTGKLKFLLK